MLDKSAVIKELSKVIPKVFFDISQEIDLVSNCFNWLKNNPDKIKLILDKNREYLLPDWSGFLNKSCFLGYNLNNKKNYTVLAVDGSQIYPDKHQGIACFLLNIGFAQINYNINSSSNSSVFLNSMPYISTDIKNAQDLSQDIVNCHRTELELQKGLELSIKIQEKMQEKTKEPFIFLCDGSLIFWHLESKEPQVQKYFLSRYLSIFQEFYNYKIPVFGFISLPKSKEILNIIRSGISTNIIPVLNNNIKNIDHVLDTDIVSLFLEPYYRTNIFLNNSSITKNYPEHLKVKFCYIDIGQEIARIEFPAWLSDNINYLDSLLEYIIDQCNKGNGYPVSLSEAHEQAVVKSADREFFYQVLYKLSINNGQKFKISQKSIKKRFISV